MDQASEISGTLHVHIAFDWGDEVDLERAKGLVRAEEHKLSRRRRTPSWIAYRPSPLTIPLGEASLDLPGMGLVKATAEATVFDFAGVSLDLSFPFRLLPDRLSMIAGQLAERDSVVKAAKALLEPLYKQLLPAIQALRSNQPVLAVDSAIANSNPFTY